MNEVIIRKFRYQDVDDFIRLSNVSFAEESLAAGLTPGDFERETRRIFRWRMIPYRMLTVLMGVRWEGFVAEKDGKVVGGGMYMGRDARMVLSNLMVDPDFRQQGIGQALLVRRIERLTELGFPFVTAEVLDTNSASLGNLRKQGFEVFNSYSEYEQTLTIPKYYPAGSPTLTLRDITQADRRAFREIEKKCTSPLVLHIQGSAEYQYFLSVFRKSYLRFAHYSRWTRTLEIKRDVLGFVAVEFQEKQSKGYMSQPLLIEESIPYFPVLLQAAGAWLAASGRSAMTVEIPDRQVPVHDYLLEHGWVKTYTWLECIKWLDEQAQREASQRFPIEMG